MKTTAVTVRFIEDLDLQFEVSRPGWLFARTSKMIGKIGLHVYKSVAMLEDDPMFAPVAEFLSKCRHEIISETTIEDEKMMFGLADWRVYLIHRVDGSDRGPSIDPDFIQEMAAARDRLLQELGVERD